MTQSILVTVEHLREAKLCIRGARQWFKLHGIDFNSFIHNGIPVEVIEATNDALGKHVAAIARAEKQGEN